MIMAMVILDYNNNDYRNNTFFIYFKYVRYNNFLKLILLAPLLLLFYLSFLTGIEIIRRILIVGSTYSLTLFILNTYSATTCLNQFYFPPIFYYYFYIIIS